MIGKLWKQWEFLCSIFYALIFYLVVIHRSLRLSHDYVGRLYGLRPGWFANRLNDVSDPQWRNFRGNLPILTLVMGAFVIVANVFRHYYALKGRGMSALWIFISLIYLLYLHGACVGFILFFGTLNYFLVKTFARSNYFIPVLWISNIAILTLNRIYEGYPFSLFGQKLAFLDAYRGTFRWHICFNLVVLRMISFGCDYHWSFGHPRFDKKRHIQRCHICSSGRTCYHALQEIGVHSSKYSFNMYLCHLIYAPLYIAGPIISYNAFAKQLETPQENYSVRQISAYGLRWVLSFLLIEAMTHFFYYNAFAISGVWWQLSPFEIFLIGYGVLNFMWLKFFLIWRYFRFWSLMGGIETPENMPRCMNNCYDLESFWKGWHASFNKWLVRKLLSWAWLTCLFFVPELLVKSAANAFQARSAFGAFIHRELSAIAGAMTISCLMVANLVGYVVGPSGIKSLVSRMLRQDAYPVLIYIFISFYVGVKLMFHIRDLKQNR